MSDGLRVRNEVDGAVGGLVVQAGAIGRVSVDPQGGGGPPVPRQLPLAVRDFVGRAGHQAALDALLPEDDGDGSGAVAVAAVRGAAGVGKTALVVRWAHRVQHRFPDGTLHADLRGYGPGEPAAPGDVLGGFLAALGLAPERIPVGVEARAAMYRSALAGRRVLVVLDNAGSAEQVRPLLPGRAGCVVVVTSRASLTGLVVVEGAVPVALDPLPEEEAVALVRAVLGPRAEDEPEAVARLVHRCDRLPLALRIAAGRTAAHPYRAIDDLVAELGSDAGRWAALSVPADERTAVRAVFDWSYHRLTAEQARAFRGLGAHPGVEFGAHVAAAAADLDVADTRRLLDDLADCHLVERAGPDRYRLHDLLRAYAAARAAEFPDEADRARRAVLEWYAHHTKAAYRVIVPARIGDMYAGAGVATRARAEVAFPSRAEAWAWVDLEIANVVPAVRLAERRGPAHLATLLAGIAGAALSTRGLWDEVFEVCALGLAVARRTGDPTSEYHLLMGLVHAHQCLGRWAEAVDRVQAALATARLLGDEGLEANALATLGWVRVEQGEYAEAAEHLRAALPLSRGVQQGGLEGFVEFALSGAHIGLGDHDRALRHAERSLALVREHGHRDAEVYAPHAMARARQGAGAHAEAIALCEQAFATVEPHYRDPRNHAFILDTMGASLRRTGDTARATTCWRAALALFEQLGDHHADALRDRLRAVAAPDPGADRPIPWRP